MAATVYRICALGGTLLLAAACATDSPLGPTPTLSEQFALAPGQAAAVQGTVLHLQFLRVSGDSRCPADAICIQGGDAIVHLRVSDAALSAEYELHTGDSTRAVVTHAGFRVELVQVDPYPFSSRPINPTEYRATLTVSR